MECGLKYRILGPFVAFINKLDIYALMDALSHLFKSSEKAFPAWHPDFRAGASVVGASEGGQRLLRNLILSILVALIGLLGFIEYHVQCVLSENRAANSRFLSMKPLNTRYLKENQEFMLQAHKIDIVSNFITPTQDWLDLVVAIFASRPAGAIFNQVTFTVKEDIKPSGKNVKAKPLPPTWEVKIAGSVKGEADLALQMLEAYKESIKSIELIKTRIINTEVLMIQRNDKTGLVDFQLVINLKTLSS